MEEKGKKVLVIAHGDLDGIVSAALEMKRSGLSIAKTRVVFTQPFLVDKIAIPEEIEKIFVVDIAVNNRDPEMTRKFIEKLGDKLDYWADHHQGWERILDQLSGEERRRFSIFDDSESAARIIAAESAFPADFPIEMVADANAADTRKGVLSWRGQLMEETVKANLSDDSIRESAVRWLVNGCKEDEDYERLRLTQQKYQKVQQETERLANQYELRDGIAIVDVKDAGEDYDRTQLLLAGEQMAPTKTAVLLGKSPEGEEIVTVATMDKERNLVDLFGLPSGAPFRISLPVANGWTAERVLKTLLRVAL